MPTTLWIIIVWLCELYDIEDCVQVDHTPIRIYLNIFRHEYSFVSYLYQNFIFVTLWSIHDQIFENKNGNLATIPPEQLYTWYTSSPPIIVCMLGANILKFKKKILLCSYKSGKFSSKQHCALDQIFENRKVATRQVSEVIKYLKAEKSIFLATFSPDIAMHCIHDEWWSKPKTNDFLANILRSNLENKKK